MSDSVTVKEAISLKHQSNLGEEVDEVALAAGTELTVLKEWEKHYLVKDDDGKIFNVSKDCVS